MATTHGQSDAQTESTSLGTDELVETLRSVRDSALALEEVCRGELALVGENDRPSARNLVHYLAARQFDLRPVQRELARRGLSSLGRAESHVLATIDAVLGHLGAWDDGTDARAAGDPPPSVADGTELLERHTVAALGRLPPGDRVRLMVTLPSEAAFDPTVVNELVAAGMDMARINCAHDDPDAWRTMAAIVREAGRVHGRQVRVAFDLAGPKLRTGPLGDGPRVVRIRPFRTVDGHVQHQARVRFQGSVGDPMIPDPARHTVVVPVDDALLTSVAIGDEIVGRDSRGRRRRFRIRSAWDGAAEATSDRTTYLTTGTRLRRRRDGATVATGRVGELQPTEAFIRLQRGDRLRFRHELKIGAPAVQDDHGYVVTPATIGCEIPELFAAIRPGHRVLIDDGAIEAVVDVVGDGEFDTTIVRPDETKLKAEKGINLPDTELAIPALTPDDRDALAVIAPIADLVALSYVGSIDDIAGLRQELDELGCHDTAVVLKIEHASAFRALPELLLYALQRPPVAVMLARGDLAVEIGFERLAEVQEQILWLCEAAHIPVIWATQVLESLAKGGLPTRAEVTDAAWASRAECVMLNKGPHVVDAMRFLADVLNRMHGHQDKRTPMLRRLSVSSVFGVVEPTFVSGQLRAADSTPNGFAGQRGISCSSTSMTTSARSG
jgi:pyruvate kinase